MEDGDERVLSLFQSTPSAWRVTGLNQELTMLRAFQSTPSAWRVTIDRMSFAFTVREISIHTLRVEGDSATFPDIF